MMLLCGDCRQYADKWAAVDAIVTDPPYGIGYKVNRRRLGPSGIAGLKQTSTTEKPPVTGDDTPFDPAPWLSAPRAALFGANNFAAALPPGRIIVWDKRCGSKSDSHSDCEFVWLSTKGADRIHRQKWRGVCREGEENCARQPKYHPNQKPVALLLRIFEELALRPGMLVGDPFMGSGSTGVAAKRFGLRFIGCELDPEYVDVAHWRVEAEPCP